MRTDTKKGVKSGGKNVYEHTVQCAYISLLRNLAMKFGSGMGVCGLESISSVVG